MEERNKVESMAHCPDKECEKKVDHLVSSAVSIKTLIGFIGIFSLAAVGSALITWADVRALPDKYCTIERMQKAEIEQARISEILKAIIDGQEDIKRSLARIERQDRK